MNEYRYWVEPQCYEKIFSFYKNVALKYRHTYSEELMHQNIDDAVDAIYQIEKTLLRRKPTLLKWAGFHMANTEKWYYAYIVLAQLMREAAEEASRTNREATTRFFEEIKQAAAAY